jgi:DNA primase
VIEQKVHLLKSAFGSCFKQGKDEYYFTCPICKHENKKKLAINIVKNSFHCWVCDLRGKNVRRLLKTRLSHSQLYEWDKLNNVVDLNQLNDDIFKSEEQAAKETVELPDSFISLANQNLPITTKFATKYLYDRGITKEDILMWKMGVCLSGEYAGRIVVPSFDLNGDCDYFVARSYGKQFPKYMNPKVSKDIVFNELFIDWNKDIVLVEGVFDAVKAENAIPLLGSTLNEKTTLFNKIIAYDPTIYMALDPDAETKSNDIINKLVHYDIQVYKIDVSGYEDVGTMTKEQFKERKNNAKLITDDWLLESQIMAI